MNKKESHTSIIYNLLFLVRIINCTLVFTERSSKILKLIFIFENLLIHSDFYFEFLSFNILDVLKKKY